MRRITTYGIIVFILFAIFDSAAAYIFKGEEIETGESAVLTRAFEASSMDLLTVNVYSSLHLPDTSFTMAEQEKIGGQLIEALQLEGEVTTISNQEYYPPHYNGEDFEETARRIYIDKQEDIGHRQFMATYTDETGNVTVIKLYTAAEEDIKESYIIIDIVQNKGYKDIGEIINQHKTLLKEFGGTIETTAAITAAAPGKMTGEETEKMLMDIIRASGAEKVEETVEDNYRSITLYTASIPYALKYDSKKVNLQLATRYNDYEKKTYLWIATPLITNTY